MDFPLLRDRIVLAALPHATFDGWSMHTLAQAAADEGLDPTLPARAFPGGVTEAVLHFIALADRRMIEDMESADLTGLRTPDRIKTAIRLRLERWAGEREAIRRATSALALAPLAAAAATFATVDAVWRAVGDGASDFSWYTKRATLAAVYSATMLFWLDDGSDGASDTLAFLDRRLADVARLPKLKEQVRSSLERLPLPGRLLRTKAAATRRFA